MPEDRSIGTALFLFGVGVFIFFGGFQSLRRKRKIENIPTSTIRGLALGLVELVGKAKKNKILHKSPLTKTDCVFYRYQIERYQSSGKSSRWVTIVQGDSCFSPFMIDDGTGTVLVSPQRAEQIMKMSFYFETGLGKVLPTSLIDFMEANHIGYKSFLGNYRLRFKEWRIHENDAVYVLGTAANISQEDYFNRRKEKLVSRIASLKNNPQAMAQVDSNQDGTISVSEWNAAVSRIEEDLLQEEINQMSLEEQSQLIIHKGDKNEVFIISDCSQKDLVSRLSWQALGGVFGGALLALGMLGYLLMRFNF